MQIIEKRVETKDQKTALVIRFGAWGDSVLINPVLRALKKDGYHTTLACSERTFDILKHDPNVDGFMRYATDEIPLNKFKEYWNRRGKLFDRVIDLTGSLEGSVVITPFQVDPDGTRPFFLSKEILNERCNKNYMDHTMAWAGYPELKGQIPELHFKKNEHEWAKKFRLKHPGFLVVWCLSGSSLHKLYPWADSVIGAIVNKYEDATVILVGEGGCRGIIDPHPRIVDLCGDFGIRKSFILTQYADLVVSPDTGVAHAASCYDTPKIIMLSHDSEENLTKYWKNCVSLSAPVKCFPCHKLQYPGLESCPLEEKTKFPVCAALLDPKRVCQAVEQVYLAWKEKCPSPHNQQQPS